MMSFGNGKEALTDYEQWISDLRPRTCLVLHWLADLGAVPEPGPLARWKAMRLTDKRSLLVMLLGRSDDLNERANQLLDNGDLDVYVAYLLWMRFLEYVPGRFVVPGGRDKVLQWVRLQLRRPELTAKETITELHWQAEQIRREWPDEVPSWFLS